MKKSQGTWVIRGGLIWLMVSSAGLRATPSLFKYWIEAIPAEGRVCADLARHIVARFKVQSGTTLAEARCTSEADGRFDIEVRYSAEKRIHPVSTIEFSVGVPSSYQGSYHTRQQCEQALPSQKEAFIRETGLDPLVSYCYRESSEARHSYVLRIDSFGKPARALLITQRELFGDPVTADLDGLEAKIREYAATKLPCLSSLALRSYVLDHAIRLLYYAEESVPVRLSELGRYQRQENCLRARKRLETRLSSMEMSTPLLCVTSKLLAQHNLQLFQIRTGVYLEPIAHPRLFASYEACEAGMEEAMKEVSTDPASPAVAGVCHDSGREVGITVLVQKRGAHDFASIN